MAETASENFINDADTRDQNPERNLDAQIKEVVERSRELEPQLIEWFHGFHENPELGGQEIQTAARVKELLHEQGIEIIAENIGLSREDKKEPEKNSAGTGIIAIIRGSKPGATVALRADMDALPIEEDSDHEVKSNKDGLMHACGHDAHTAGLIGAGMLLKEQADRGGLEGNVLLMFQPSEEKAHQKESGAVQMVKYMEEKGIRKDVDAFYGLHVAMGQERGTVSVKDGVQMASSGEIDIKLKSEGGHIINSYENVNLNSLFSQIQVKLEKIFEPLADKGEALVANSQPVYKGAPSYNVMPDTGEATYVVRIPSETYKQLTKAIIQTIDAVVKQTVWEHVSKLSTKPVNKDKPPQNMGVEIIPRPGYRPVIHRSRELVELADQASADVYGQPVNLREPMFGGEDFSFYLERFGKIGKGNDERRQIPGVFVMVGAANPEKGIPLGKHHTSNFEIDPEVVKDLSAMHASFALRTLNLLKWPNREPDEAY